MRPSVEQELAALTTGKPAQAYHGPTAQREGAEIGADTASRDSPEHGIEEAELQNGAEICDFTPIVRRKKSAL